MFRATQVHHQVSCRNYFLKIELFGTKYVHKEILSNWTIQQCIYVVLFVMTVSQCTVHTGLCFRDSMHVFSPWRWFLTNRTFWSCNFVLICVCVYIYITTLRIFCTLYYTCNTMCGLRRHYSPHDVSVTIKTSLSATETLKVSLFHSLYRSVALRTVLAGDDVVNLTFSSQKLLQLQLTKIV